MPTICDRRNRCTHPRHVATRNLLNALEAVKEAADALLDLEGDDAEDACQDNPVSYSKVWSTRDEKEYWTAACYETRGFLWVLNIVYDSIDGLALPCSQSDRRREQLADTIKKMHHKSRDDAEVVEPDAVVSAR
jgi:hypothetical protein